MPSLAALIPTPLHPAIVHLPIALAVLLPIFAIGALIAIRRGARPLPAWAIPTALAAVLTVGSWAALETGQQQEDRVEDAVPRAALHGHEESAEAFLGLSVALLGIAALGLAPRRIGSAARAIATLGTLGLLVAGYRVGHSGGELVYAHGAASVYVTSRSALSDAGAPVQGEHEADDDH